MLESDLNYIFKWWLILTLIGLSFFPISSRLFNNFLDKGYIFSKIIGLLIITYTIYLISSLEFFKFTTLNIFICWLFFIPISLYLLKKNKLYLTINKRLILVEELIFLIAIIIWALVRSYSPDIHGLEKFMDFGFINSIMRSEYFPPKDMWLTPDSINYYYFGHLFTAVITKLTNIPSFITFNLMLSTIFAFTLTMSFSIGINLISQISKFSQKKNLLLGLLFGIFVSLAGNLQTIYSLFKNYTGAEKAPPFWTLDFLPNSFPNSYWYPNATRFIYRTIHEFPSYSFVVADLHGHVLSIPIVLTIIAVLLSIFLNKKISFFTSIMVAFLISCAYMTNAWDGLIYLGLGVLTIIFINTPISKIKIFQKFKKTIFKSVISLLILIFGLFIFTYIFNNNFIPFASGIGINCSPEQLIKLEKLGPFVFEKDQCQITPFWQILVLYGLFIFMIASFILFIRNKKILISDYFVIFISFFSLILILVPEILYLKDIYAGYFRANTMFKLSYQAYMMFSISSIYILIRIVFDFKKENKSKNNIFYFFTFLIPSLVLLFFTCIYSFFAIPSGYGDFNKYKGLDGIKYLSDSRPGDYKAINYLNTYVKGQPVILEAQGDSYTDFGRVSSNTGLPTVLGWTVHEWLWRGSYDIPSSRFDDIKRLYETDETYTAEKIINKYKISLIYIGSLEKEKYKVSEEKFSKLGKILYQNNEVKIFKLD